MARLLRGVAPECGGAPGALGGPGERDVEAPGPGGEPLPGVGRDRDPVLAGLEAPRLPRRRQEPAGAVAPPPERRADALVEGRERLERPDADRRDQPAPL